MPMKLAVMHFCHKAEEFDCKHDGTIVKLFQSEQTTPKGLGYVLMFVDGLSPKHARQLILQIQEYVRTVAIGPSLLNTPLSLFSVPAQFSIPNRYRCMFPFVRKILKLDIFKM